MNNELHGIKIWGWLGIIVGIFSSFIMIAIVSLIVAKHTGFYDAPTTWQQLYYFLSLFICGSLLLIGGIQLLRLKESGRKIYVFVAFTDIAITIYRYVGGLFASTASNKLDSVSGIIVQLILPVWLLYFFTRPKVKEQFK